MAATVGIYWSPAAHIAVPSSARRLDGGVYHSPGSAYIVLAAGRPTPLHLAVDPRAATLASQTSNPFAVDPRAATLASQTSNPFAVDPRAATLVA